MMTTPETAVVLPSRHSSFSPRCWSPYAHALAMLAILCLLVDELLRFVPAHAVA